MSFAEHILFLVHFFKLGLNLFVFNSQFSLHQRLLGLGIIQGSLQSCQLIFKLLLLSSHLTFFQVKLILLLIHDYRHVLDLGLKSCDCLRQLSLVFKVCIPDELGVI